jgi:polar amino acid transport system permease protein/cystine transport system permease protein
LGNQFILTIKESAVASIITVPELTMTTSQIVANTYSYLALYLADRQLLAAGAGVSMSIKTLSHLLRTGE